MSTELQSLISAARNLSDDDKQVLLRALSQESVMRTSRAEIVRSVRGKYADVETSVETFLARRREDMALE
jgi:hypothetical protein